MPSRELTAQWREELHRKALVPKLHRPHLGRVDHAQNPLNQARLVGVTPEAGKVQPLDGPLELAGHRSGRPLGGAGRAQEHLHTGSTAEEDVTIQHATAELIKEFGADADGMEG